MSVDLVDDDDLDDDVHDQLKAAEATIDRLRMALDASVTLQSHYAGILNSYDEGKRMVFADVDAWMKRLDELVP